MEKLTQLNCTPLTAASVSLNKEDIKRYLSEVPQWQLVQKEGVPCLEQTFKFKNFSDALKFTLSVGRAADEQDHHPSLLTEWGKVTVNWWTHKVKGLHLNDFIMAAKTDQIYSLEFGY